MAKRERMPKVIMTPNGRYVPAVFIINTKNENGTPRLCTMFPNDKHEITLAGGEEFMIGYIHEKMYKGSDRA